MSRLADVRFGPILRRGTVAEKAENIEPKPLPDLSETITRGDDSSRTKILPQPDFPQVPGYTITGRLGQGGMGAVWRAVQLSTGREVAVKLMSPSVFGSTRAQARFLREVELVARLEHPHIARIVSVRPSTSGS
jgi:serine/threonine protein kinase